MSVSSHVINRAEAPPDAARVSNVKNSPLMVLCSEEWGAEHLGAGPLRFPLECGTHPKSR